MAPRDLFGVQSPTMRPVGEIRLENLELLIAAAGTMERVAEKAGTTSVYLSQVRNHTIDKASGKPREMGAKMARRIEDAFEKPRGWMDVEHAESRPAFSANAMRLAAEFDRIVRPEKQTQVYAYCLLVMQGYPVSIEEPVAPAADAAPAPSAPVEPTPTATPQPRQETLSG